MREPNHGEFAKFPYHRKLATYWTTLASSHEGIPRGTCASPGDQCSARAVHPAFLSLALSWLKSHAVSDDVALKEVACLVAPGFGQTLTSGGPE